MAVAFTQVGFRGRFDDGSETGATWKKAVNVNWTEVPGRTFRVRFDCSETGTTASTLAGQLQCNKNAGAFQAVTGSSTIVKAAASSVIVDGVATTQIISSGSFIAGSIDAVDGLCATTASIAQSSHTELEFTLQINAADVVEKDVIQLRVVRSPSTAFGTYTNTPSITVVDVMPNVGEHSQPTRHYLPDVVSVER